MNLTEKAMINLLKEEYESRLAFHLLEKLELKSSKGLDVWADANMRKVKHTKSGLEFTFCCFKDNDVILYAPEEGRFDSDDVVKQDKLLSDDKSFSKKSHIDIFGGNTPDENKSYYVLSKEKFKKEFSI